MRTRTNRLLLFLTLVISLFGSVSTHATELKIGVYSNKPKIFMDETGRASGILIDILGEIANSEQWQLKFVACEWENCLRALKNGEIDLLPDVAFSSERSTTFSFHEIPVLYSWAQIYRHPEVSIMSLLDLDKKRVAMLRGSVQERFFSGLSISLGLKTYALPVATLDEGFRMVQQRKADAVIANNYFGDQHAAQYHLVDTAIVFQPSELFYAAELGQHHEVLATLDRYLKIWKGDPDSVYFAILKKWRVQPQEKAIPPAVWWSLFLACSLLVLAILITIYLRRQVSTKARNLVETEYKLATILDSIGSLVYIKDTGFRYQYVNGAMCRLLGKTASEIIGKNDKELFGKTTAHAIHEVDRRVIERGEKMVIEEIDMPARERTRTFLSTKIPLCRDNGTVYALCGIATDISDRKQMEEALRISSAVFQSQEAMFVTGPDRMILEVNQAFSAMTGYAPDEIVAEPILPFTLEKNGPEYRAHMWEIVENTSEWQGEVWMRRKNGEEYPAWLTITAVRDAKGRTTNYVGTQTDIAQQKLAQHQITQLAYYDALTGLPNRTLLLDKLHDYLSVHDYEGKLGALLFIDLDNFKDLNDSRGHEFGDQLLKQVADRLRHSCRESDTVARIGGDEFVILMEQVGHTEQEVESHTINVGQKILNAVGQSYEIAGGKYHTTCSIGAAPCNEPGLQINDLMRRADLAMYQAKRDGRNLLRFYHPDMESDTTLRLELEMEMREAIGTSQFELHYQPQVDSTGRIFGAEVLLRWHHPRRGMISPGMFIPIAESSELILPLGCWVLETACNKLAEWASSLEMRQLSLAVNVSARQFRQPHFVAQTLQILKQTGAPPSRLKLELTETSVIVDIEETIEKMRVLKGHGIGFSLDDFGTGYSSLSYLKRLPLDQLKIDQSFVRDILTDPNDASIAQSIVALGNALGLEVIAEGVEEQAQRNFLAEIGCHFYQGYLFGYPSDIDTLHRLVTKNATH